MQATPLGIQWDILGYSGMGYGIGYRGTPWDTIASNGISWRAMGYSDTMEYYIYNMYIYIYNMYIYIHIYTYIYTHTPYFLYKCVPFIESTI